MTDYKGIQGVSIQSVASDPSVDEGQVWYNNASYAIKLASVTTAGTWASGGALPSARNGNPGGAGTQTAGLAFGGGGPAGGGAPITTTSTYNGTSWSDVNSLNTARGYMVGCGTQTAALIAGGNPAATELWNGTSWTTNPANMNTSRSALGASTAGTQTATLAFGGSSPVIASSESWNGSSWTNTPSLNTARRGLSGLGTQAAALALGGYPVVTTTESWNGSSWTTVNSMNTARGFGRGVGPQTAGLAFAGYGPTTPTYNGATELWN